MESDKKITLNVGGKCFMVYQSTLLKYPETMLARMYVDNNNFKVDEVQFFDRSSKLFEHILNFYRSGLLCKPLFVNKLIWSEEIKYWGLPDLEIEKQFDIEDSIQEIIKMINEGKLKGEIGPPGPPGQNGRNGQNGKNGQRGAMGPPGRIYVPGEK